MTQYGVTALNKDHAIVCGLCLVLDHLLGSEHGNITLKEYLGVCAAESIPTTKAPQLSIFSIFIVA